MQGAFWRTSFIAFWKYRKCGASSGSRIITITIVERTDHVWVNDKRFEEFEEMTMMLLLKLPTGLWHSGCRWCLADKIFFFIDLLEGWGRTSNITVVEGGGVMAVQRKNAWRCQEIAAVTSSCEMATLESENRRGIRDRSGRERCVGNITMNHI